jgi:AraC-like DNA-binding protein
MKCPIQHEPLLVELLDVATWEAPQPLRDHFALVSIRQGSGAYLAAGHRLPYQPGSMLLLGPTDCYHFAIDQATQFGQLRFTEEYLTSLTATGAQAGAWQQLRDAARSATLGQLGYLTLGATEPQLSTLLAMLFDEYGGQQPGHDPLARSLMGAVLSLIGRHLATPAPLAQRGSFSYAASVVQRLLAYIRHHIADTGRLRIEELASTFAYSPSHLSELFRRETGESLRQYIVRYRLWLAEARLQVSTLTISQIADELGFVDVCHLNKLFKKRYQLTPTEYRRQLAVAASY